MHCCSMHAGLSVLACCRRKLNEEERKKEARLERLAAWKKQREQQQQQQEPEVVGNVQQQQRQQQEQAAPSHPGPVANGAFEQSPEPEGKAADVWWACLHTHVTTRACTA